MTAALRAPVPADFVALASWIPDAEACARWAGPRVPFPFVPTTLPALLEVADRHSYFLADDTGSPVGFGQHWILTPGGVHLGRIIVSPLERGRGLGRVLCELLIDRAVSTTGASTLTLRVYRDNTAALSLYTSLGFIPIETESTEAVLFMSACAGGGSTQ